MFVSRRPVWAASAVAAVAAGLALAGPGGGAAPETRYVVEPGDTLWAIAAERYEGDPREAIWRIRERNGLETSLLRPGMVLALPGS